MGPPAAASYTIDSIRPHVDYPHFLTPPSHLPSVFDAPFLARVHRTQGVV
jgi:hypothetical protein